MKRAERKVKLKAWSLKTTTKLTVDGIVTELVNEFGQDAVPDRSNVARWLQRFKEKMPPEELSEDEPFVWSTMSEVPWENSRGILDARYAHLQRGDRVGPFTRRLAKWTWRVLNAIGLADEANSVAPRIPGTSRLRRDPDRRVTWPNAIDVAGIAQEYALRETASLILGEEFQTQDLDLWLTFRPWHGKNWLDRYQATRDRLGLFSYVQWHVTDEEWLKRVAPAEVEGILADLLSRIGLDVAAEDGADDFLKATDGLLRSQFIEYVAWAHTSADGQVQTARPIESQWYLDYLDGVMSSLSA